MFECSSFVYHTKNVQDVLEGLTGVVFPLTVGLDALKGPFQPK